MNGILRLASRTVVIVSILVVYEFGLCTIIRIIIIIGMDRRVHYIFRRLILILIIVILSERGVKVLSLLLFLSVFQVV